MLEGRNYISKKDVPITIKTALSTAQIERTSIFGLLLANGGSLTTSRITASLNISKNTALRTMAELKVVGLVDEDETMGEMRVTLRPKFDWFLSDEFAELSQGFKPVDYSVFLKEKDGDQCKEKSSPHTSDFSNENDGPSKEDSQLSNFLASKLDDFWRIYDELETEQAHSPESTMCIDSVDAANVSIDSSGICTQ